MLLFGTIAGETYHKKCNQPKLCSSILPQKYSDCTKHRLENKIIPIVYPELSHFENAEMDEWVCLFVSHKSEK